MSGAGRASPEPPVSHTQLARHSRAVEKQLEFPRDQPGVTDVGYDPAMKRLRAWLLLPPDVLLNHPVKV